MQQGFIDPSSFEIKISVASDRTAVVSIVSIPKQNVFLYRPTLRNLLSNIDNSNIHNILIGIAAGMKHIHDHGMAHTNLCDTTIVICENGDIIITDLKNYRNFAGGSSQASEKQQNNSTDAKLDIFNFGLILDEMFTKKPSNEVSRRSQYTQAPSYVPSSYVNLFTKCLNSRIENRPTFTQILEELQGMTLQNQILSALQGKSVYRPASNAPVNALETKRFRGVIPAFYACYDKNGNVSEVGTRALATYLFGISGVVGLYVGGSSGEGIYQTVEERKKVLEWVNEVKPSDKVIIAHVGCNNLSDSRTLASHAQDKCKVEAIASIPPIYFKLPEYSIADYWAGISDAAKQTPFIIYNIPQLAGVNLTTSLIKTMLQRCPNTLLGVKNSSVPTQDIQMWRDAALQNGRTDENFIVFNGPDEQFVSGLAIGALGGIGGTYASMPQLFVKAFQYVTDSTNPNNEKAMAIQNDICRIIYKMVSCRGNLYSVMKEIIRLQGGPDCGDVRPPLSAHTEEDMEIIREAKDMIDAAIAKYKD